MLDKDTGDVAVRFWAENDRLLFPHECVQVWWSVVGDAELKFNGTAVTAEDYVGSGNHCAENGDRATLEMLANDGSWRSYELPIPSLFSSSQTPPLYFWWSLVAILLGLMVYLPWIVQAIRSSWGRGLKTDLLAAAGCLLFVLMLYLPFGFDSAGHWEEWVIRGYFEGGALRFFRAEAVSRFFVMIPHAIAHLLSPESFVGHHLVNLLMYSGSMILLYGILRHLGMSPLYAFLTSILYIAYPVNSTLMSLRQFPLNFSVLALFAAIYLILDYSKRPKRLTLIGAWLGLMLSVFTNETGFAVILAVPLLWRLRQRRLNWKNLNLTVIWYLAPAFKLAYIILLLLANRDFYQRGLFESDTGNQASSDTVLGTAFQVMSRVYHQTFVEGWREALATVAQNSWWIVTALMIAGVGAIALYLARERKHEELPAARAVGVWLVGGLLFIIPAIGILMWFPLYRDDVWRIYLFVPAGAALTVTSLILLVTASIAVKRYRYFALIALCALALIPAVSRLLVQMDYYVFSAHSKARVLSQIIELAPGPDQHIQFAVLTGMSHETLREKGLFELLNNDMVNSALHVLYQNGAPDSAYFCASINQCGDFGGDETLFSSSNPDELLQRTLVFKLNEDLSVELLADPAAYLGFDSGIPYDATQLYDPYAPLPSRATTMLGAALKG